MSEPGHPPRDEHLMKALLNAYSARAVLFHSAVRKTAMRQLFKAVDRITLPPDAWVRPETLGIEQASLDKLRQGGVPAHAVFVHPRALQRNPRLVAYYRNLVALSQKGMSQLGSPTQRFERARPAEMNAECASKVAVTLNRFASRLVESIPEFRLSHERDVAFAELGSEIQGTWANIVGKGAAKAVEDLFVEHITSTNRGRRQRPHLYELDNGWQVVFGSEPDAQFTDASGRVQIAIEIKGSLDKAGAQTRYGEAKKSFGKALRANPRCHTIYLASCFTDAVVSQIESDGQVRARFNLTSILYEPRARARFLEHLFHIIDAPQ